MSHPIYFNKLCNDAMHLEQIVSASKAYVTSLHDYYFSEKEHDYEVSELDMAYDDYLIWLYENVSSLLIQCATQTRIYQDSYLNDAEEEEEPYSSDKEAYEHMPQTVEVISGKFHHSLRECCNKIIHAETFDLEFVSTSNTPKYWSGKCVLKGKIGKNSWHIKMDILKFCLSLRYFYGIEKHEFPI